MKNKVFHITQKIGLVSLGAILAGTPAIADTSGSVSAEYKTPDRAEAGLLLRKSFGNYFSPTLEGSVGEDSYKALGGIDFGPVYFFLGRENFGNWDSDILGLGFGGRRVSPYLKANMIQNKNSSNPTADLDIGLQILPYDGDRLRVIIEGAGHHSGLKNITTYSANINPKIRLSNRFDLGLNFRYIGDEQLTGETFQANAILSYRFGKEYGKRLRNNRSFRNLGGIDLKDKVSITSNKKNGATDDYSGWEWTYTTPEGETIVLPDEDSYITIPHNSRNF
jgi:hypothetical protein